jgi:hypothetical protein
MKQEAEMQYHEFITRGFCDSDKWNDNSVSNEIL